MRAATSDASDPFVKAVLDALGNPEGVRSITIRMKAGDPVVVEVEQYLLVRTECGEKMSELCSKVGEYLMVERDKTL